jgi:indole-3-glycerol phosphate synthase
MTILDQIVDYKQNVELPARMRALPLEELQRRAAVAPPPRDLVAALRRPAGVALIAEVKRASPSRGVLRAGLDPLQLAGTYAANGAAAISVLTDAPFFQGDLAHLAAIRRHLDTEVGCSMPLLRKDFVVHPYQVYEARAAGADALLLIAAILSGEQLAELFELTRQLGMAALVEVHAAAELARVLALNPRLIGANNRDLRNFDVNLETCLALRRLVPRHICLVAESGIHTRADVEQLAAAGVDAMLVGEALVTAADPAAKMRELTGDHQT